MRKAIPLILAAILVLSLCGCDSQAVPQQPQQAAPAEFLVGFGRMDITPTDLGAPLAGYGQTHTRLHTTVLDKLYVSAVAITGTNGDTIILMCVDLINSTQHDVIRKRIEAELGIPYDNVMLAATHTHSAWDQGVDANATLVAQYHRDAVTAVQKALEDRSPATISIGRTEIAGLNYIRHYIMNDGSYAGANFGSFSSGIKGYAAENDESVQLIKFTRPAEDKKDIIMVNAQGHPLVTSGVALPDMSADVVGAARQQIEYQTKAHFIFFLGASGDVNMGTKLPSGKRETMEDYQVFGTLLANGVIAALDTMEPANTGNVRVLHQTYMGTVNREMEDRLSDAIRIRDYYNDTDRDTGNILARELGFSSVYHASGVITRSKITEDQLPIKLGIYAFGDISFAAAPYEMFAAHGMQIKDGSPYKMTFVATCANGAEGYLPTEYAFQFGCYESHTSRFTGDTGTKCAETFISMMETMKSE